MVKRGAGDLGAVVLGLGVAVSCYLLVDPLTVVLVFLLASALLVFGLFDFSCMLHGLSKRNLIKNESGLAWIWIVGLGLTLPMCALVYWCLDYPFDLIVGTVSGMYTFTGTMAYAWTTTQLVLSYLLAFVVVFAVAWIIQTSKSPYGS